MPKYQSAKSGKVYDVPDGLSEAAVDKFIELKDGQGADTPASTTPKSTFQKVKDVATTPLVKPFNTNDISLASESYPVRAGKELFNSFISEGSSPAALAASAATGAVTKFAAPALVKAMPFFGKEVGELIPYLNKFGKSAESSVIGAGESGVLPTNAPRTAPVDPGLAAGPKPVASSGPIPNDSSITGTIPPSNEFIPVGDEPPVPRPVFNDPSQKVFDKVMEQKGSSRGVEVPPVIGPKRVKLVSKVRPQSDGSIDLLNPDQTTVQEMLNKGFQPTGEVNPDNSIKLVRKVGDASQGAGPQPVTSPLDIKSPSFQEGGSGNNGGGLPPNEPPPVNAVAPNPEPKPILQHPGDTTYDKVMSVLRAPRSMMATGNLHALMRQGLFLADRPEYWKSLGPMLKSMGSEEGDQAVKANIAKLPTQVMGVDTEGNATKSIAQKAGLALTEFGSKTNSEEAFPPSLADKIPYLRGMNRGFTAFLNNLRATTFDTLYNNSTKDGVDFNPKTLAKTINTLSGRGPAKSNDLTNTFLFSPKLFSSRLQILQAPLKTAGSYAQPVTDKILPSQLAKSFNNYVDLDPVSRQQMARSLVTVSSSIASLLGLAKASGYEVTFNPKSSDFGKIRKGSTAVDLTGGLGPYIRLVARLSSGESIGPMPAMKKTDIYAGKYGKKNGLDLTNDFVESHASPYAQLAMDSLRGNKNFIGVKNDFKTLNPAENRIMQMFMPLFAEDVWKVLKNDPKSKELLVPGFLGSTVQADKYPAKKAAGR
jgi:hypothetical protein